MPALETHDLYERALLWPSPDGGFDRYGAPTVTKPAVGEEPTEISARWVRAQSQALDPRGNVITVDMTVVVDQDITIGSVMWDGSLDDLVELVPGTSYLPAFGLLEVLTFNKTRDIRNRFTRRTVGLKRLRDTALPTDSTDVPEVEHGSQTFTSSGTFTALATSTTFQAFGTGGDGLSFGGGGGGGGASARTVFATTIGQNYTVTIAAGVVTTVTEDSTSTIVVKADYGRSASSSTGAAGGLASNSTGDVKYSGGNGGDGGFVSGGGGGSSAGTDAAGSNGSNTDPNGAPGGVAPSGGGDGGTGFSGASGGNGSAPGGGGGGDTTFNSTSGIGAAGKVTITW